MYENLLANITYSSIRTLDEMNKYDSVLCENLIKNR